MPKERDILKMIFSNFVKSLMPKPIRGNHMGTDLLGNKYYEITAESNKGRRRRWFVPEEKDNFEQELPGEWESWLRGRRIEPPQEEEILKNALIMQMKQKNAEELKLKFGTNLKNDLLEETKKGLASYPKYEEYEIMPGKKQK